MVVKQPQAITFTSTPGRARRSAAPTTATGHRRRLGQPGDLHLGHARPPARSAGAAASFVAAGTGTISADQAGDAELRRPPRRPPRPSPSPRRPRPSPSPRRRPAPPPAAATRWPPPAAPRATPSPSPPPPRRCARCRGPRSASWAPAPAPSMPTRRATPTTWPLPRSPRPSPWPRRRRPSRRSSLPREPGGRPGAGHGHCCRGGFNPTGTVTFRLFSDPNCNTQAFTSTNPVGHRPRTGSRRPRRAPTGGPRSTTATPATTPPPHRATPRTSR